MFKNEFFYYLCISVPPPPPHQVDFLTYTSHNNNLKNTNSNVMFVLLYHKHGVEQLDKYIMNIRFNLIRVQRETS